MFTFGVLSLLKSQERLRDDLFAVLSLGLGLHLSWGVIMLAAPLRVEYSGFQHK